ncbi:hypothetical protein [Mesorhizobium sp. M0220]
MNDSDSIRIQIAGTDLVFRTVPINDQTPSGDQIALGVFIRRLQLCPADV